jgi:hypothetical protein
MISTSNFHNCGLISVIFGTKGLYLMRLTMYKFYVNWSILKHILFKGVNTVLSVLSTLYVRFVRNSEQESLV